MTTYAYKLALNDDGVITLKESLKLMIEKCNAVLKEVETNPNKQIADQVNFLGDSCCQA